MNILYNSVEEKNRRLEEIAVHKSWLVEKRRREVNMDVKKVSRGKNITKKKRWHFAQFIMFGLKIEEI